MIIQTEFSQANYPPNGPPAIIVDSVEKTFRIYDRPLSRFLDYIRPAEGRYYEIKSLKNISFSVNKGECFGIIGENGSGKSTLLKIISGTLLPNAGSVKVNGRVLALLELGGGINPELSGRQNIIVSAGLLGLPAQYAHQKMNDIEKFADIGDFFDRPMRIYSSGMFVRLTFSIYLFMDPDILIVDEALSVGDIFFQQKCFRALRDIIENGTTVLFVSHDTTAVQKLCDRALLLSRGEVMFLGRPDEAVNRFHTAAGQRSPAIGPDFQQPAAFEKPSNVTENAVEDRVALLMEANQLSAPVISLGGGLTILAVRTVNSTGRPVASVQMAEKVTIEVLVEAGAVVLCGDVGIGIYDRFDQLIFRSSASRAGQPLSAFSHNDKRIVNLEVDCRIFTGHYGYRVEISDEHYTGDEVARSSMLGPLIVRSDRETSPFYGVVGLPCKLIEASSEPSRSGS